MQISDDCAALVKENAALSSQVLELQKHLDLVRDVFFNRLKITLKQFNRNRVPIEAVSCKNNTTHSFEVTSERIL